jgi:murein DD-endopeptidase MepM/ murein hydrolase activator NlpD
MSQQAKSGSPQIADKAAKMKKAIETVKAIAEAAAGNWMSLIKLLLPIAISIVLTVFIFTNLFTSYLFSSNASGETSFVSPDEISSTKIQQEIIDCVTDAYGEANAEMLKKIDSDYKSKSSGYDTTTITIVNPLENADIMETEIYKVYAMFTVYKDRVFMIDLAANPVTAIKDQADIYKTEDLKKMMKDKYDELLTYTVSSNPSSYQPKKWDEETKTMVDDGDPVTSCSFTYTISVSNIDLVGPSIFDLADRTGDMTLPEEARIDEIEMAKTKAISIAAVFGTALDEYGGDAEMTGLGKMTGQTTFVSKADYSAYIEKYSVSNINFTPASKMVVPLGGVYSMTSPFGPRIHPIKKVLKFHTGIDLSVSSGTDIYSLANGVVVKTGYSDGYGNFAIVYHGEIDGSYYFTTYNHMKEPASVSAGQSVTAATVIGHVGSTGLSTGPHLHFEVRVGTEVNGEFSFVFRDPALFLSLPQ